MSIAPLCSVLILSFYVSGLIFTMFFVLFAQYFHCNSFLFFSQLYLYSATNTIVHTILSNLVLILDKQNSLGLLLKC